MPILSPILDARGFNGNDGDGMWIVCWLYCISLASLNRNGRLGRVRCVLLRDCSEYRRLDLEMKRKDRGLHPSRVESSNAKTKI